MVSFSPCWVQVEPERVNTHAAPWPAKRCRLLIAAQQRYASALGQASALSEAGAVAIDRYAGALQATDGLSILAQKAAIAVKFGEAASAYARVARAGRTVGALIHGTPADLALTARQVASIRAKLERGQGIRAGVAATAIANGTAGSMADITQTLREAFATGGPSRTLRLSTALAQRPQLSEFTRKWQAIAPADVTALVDVLAAQHTISSLNRARLGADLTKISAACTTKARSAAASHLLTDVRHRSSGQARLLLEGAVQPFERFHNKISQALAKCAKPPSTKHPRPPHHH
jgi:hypothetical protein